MKKKEVFGKRVDFKLDFVYFWHILNDKCRQTLNDRQSTLSKALKLADKALTFESVELAGSQLCSLVVSHYVRHAGRGWPENTIRVSHRFQCIRYSQIISMLKVWTMVWPKLAEEAKHETIFELTSRPVMVSDKLAFVIHPSLTSIVWLLSGITVWPNGWDNPSISSYSLELLF